MTNLSLPGTISTPLCYDALVNEIDSVYLPFGKALALRRERVGLSQNEMAAALGLRSNASISKWEARAEPIKDIDLLEGIAKVLECSVDDLRRGRIPAGWLGVRVEGTQQPATTPRRGDAAESLADMFRRVTEGASDADRAEMAAVLREVMSLSFKRIRRIRRTVEADLEEQEEDESGSGGGSAGGQQGQGERKQRPYRTRGKTYNRPSMDVHEASAR